MNIFQKIRKVVAGMFHQTKVAAALGVEIAVSSKMEENMQIWSEMYQDEPSWKNEEKGKLTLGLPAAIASEMARLVTLEMKSEIAGSARADWLNEQYKPVIEKARRFTEFACADGGVVLKPYVTKDKKLGVSEVSARDFYPTTFDSDGDITGGVFVDYKYDDKHRYTRFEHHDIQGDKLVIRNKVFRLLISEVTTKDEAIGQEVSLTDVPEWADIQPEVEIRNVSKVLFSYFKMPFANHVEKGSPLGVSCYSKAVDLIKQADRQWSEIDWEYRAGEASLHVASSLLPRDYMGMPVIPEGKERLYETFDFERSVAKQIEEFHPEFRDDSLFHGLNKILQRIEFNVGLAYGTLSDPQEVEKTAEEIRTSKQRSYSTVSDIQKALQKALEHLVYAMDVMATLYGLAPAGGYAMSFEWDDSIVVDAETERVRDLNEVREGLMQKWEYRVKWKGETEAQARKMVEEGATDDEIMDFRKDRDMDEPDQDEGNMTAQA